MKTEFEKFKFYMKLYDVLIQNTDEATADIAIKAVHEILESKVVKVRDMKDCPAMVDLSALKDEVKNSTSILSTKNPKNWQQIVEESETTGKQEFTDTKDTLEELNINSPAGSKKIRATVLKNEDDKSKLRHPVKESDNPKP